MIEKLRGERSREAHGEHDPTSDAGSNPAPATNDATTYMEAYAARSKKPYFSARMQRCIDRLGISLKVIWAPKPDSAVHGEFLSGCLLIYDETEAEAWETFTHELVEYKLREVTQVYRVLVNQLIEGYEKLAYQQKERFIDALPKILETIQAEMPREALSVRRRQP